MHHVPSVDLVTISVNPAVDVGQIEGALVMGLGQMLYERMTYDPKSGRLLSNSTWVG